METQHEKSRVGVGPRRWQARRLRKRQEVSHVSVDEVHLLGDVVPAQLFIEFQKAPSLERSVVLVKGFFPVPQEIWKVGRKIEVQLPALPDAFQGPEKEGAVLDDGASRIRACVPMRQEGSVLSGNIGGIERIVSMKRGEESVPLTGSALADNVHH